MNVVVLSGNLGQDPEIRYTPKRTAVANLSLCVNGGKDSQGQPVRDWFRVVCFNKTAENVGQYVGKGQKILVRGELRTRSYDDREGQKRTVTEIWAASVEFLSPKKEGAGASKTGGKSAAASGKETTPPAGAGGDFGDGFPNDDIPF